MNKGLTGRQCAETVKLPPHLRNHPYLIEYYGTVEWSVRAVYHGYIGWFSGRPADLHPLPVAEEARLMVELAGGSQNVMANIKKKAVTNKQWQWGLKLCDMILDSGENLPSEELEETIRMRSQCLRELAAKEVSAPGRNWYRTEDLVMGGLQIRPSKEARIARIMESDIRSLFQMMSCMVNPDVTSDVMMAVEFNFTDTNKLLRLEMRKGVCQVTTGGGAAADLGVVTTEAVWRRVMTRSLAPQLAMTSGQMSVTPDLRKLATFFSFFEFE